MGLLDKIKTGIIVTLLCFSHFSFGQTIEFSVGTFSEFHIQKQPFSPYYPKLSQHTSLGLRLGFELPQKKGNWLFLVDFSRQKAGISYDKFPQNFVFTGLVHNNRSALQVSTIWLYDLKIGSKFVFKVGPGLGFRFAPGGGTNLIRQEYYINGANRYDINYEHSTNALISTPILLHSVIEMKINSGLNLFLSLNYQVGLWKIYTIETNYVYSINNTIFDSANAIYVNRGSRWNANLGLKFNLIKPKNE